MLFVPLAGMWTSSIGIVVLPQRLKLLMHTKPVRATQTGFRPFFHNPPILHTFRVYLTGGLKKPREMIWLLGILLSIYTGRLLGAHIAHASLMMIWAGDLMSLHHQWIAI